MFLRVCCLTFDFDAVSREHGNIEIIAGLIEGDIIAAEGLKKVKPQGKIQPIFN